MAGGATSYSLQAAKDGMWEREAANWEKDRAKTQLVFYQVNKKRKKGFTNVVVYLDLRTPATQSLFSFLK